MNSVFIFFYILDVDILSMFLNYRMFVIVLHTLLFRIRSNKKMQTLKRYTQYSEIEIFRKEKR